MPYKRQKLIDWVNTQHRGIGGQVADAQENTNMKRTMISHEGRQIESIKTPHRSEFPKSPNTEGALHYSGALLASRFSLKSGHA